MIKNIESKIRLALVSAVAGPIAGIIIAIGGQVLAYKQLNKERDKIYILQNNIPTTAIHSFANNRMAEYKGLVDVYHTLFFTLPPDDPQINYQMKKASYLVDNSGVREYNNLKEKGFFSNILSNSAFINIQVDSINIDPTTKDFTFYGTEIISRLSSTLTRNLITKGTIKDIVRSDNNPFGAIITNWRTVANKDISTSKKNMQ